MDQIDVQQVSNARDFHRFIRFPFSLYKDNAYWAPGFDFDEKRTLSSKNPALNHCELAMFLGWRSSKVVGRIAVIINRRYNELHNCAVARFGWIDFIDNMQVSKMLIQTAKIWSKDRGMKEMHGPLGFCDFDYEGMLVEGFDQPSTMSTIYNYSYYNNHMLALGLEKQTDWIERTIRKKSAKWNTPLMQRRADIISKRFRLRLAKPKSKKELLAYIPEIFQLVNKTYGDLYSYTPLTSEQITYYTKTYFSVAVKQYIPIVLDEYGKVVGFFVLFPSFSKVLRKIQGKLFPFGWLRILRTMRKHKVADFYLGAIDSNYRNKGLLALMYSQITPELDKRGVEYCETNIVLENNLEMNNVYDSDRAEYISEIVKRRRCYFINL